jgi:hypothetical protein
VGLQDQCFNATDRGRGWVIQWPVATDTGHNTSSF